MFLNFFKTWLLLIFKIFSSNQDLSPMAHLKRKLEILKASFSCKLTSKLQMIEMVDFNQYSAQKSKIIEIVEFNQNLFD